MFLMLVVDSTVAMLSTQTVVMYRLGIIVTVQLLSIQHPLTLLNFLC